ncbi:MAG TPA: hypothetical protein VGB82_14925 [Alphaproteobacteria bacterium]
MTLFSPAALMRVLTTLVDRSLDEGEPAPGERKTRRRARRAHFSKQDKSGVLRPHLELARRGDAHEELHGQVD